MKNKQWYILGTATLSALLLAAPDAEAACTHHKRNLRLGVNAISLQQTDARCVLSGVDGESGTFEIKVQGLGSYVPDLHAITVEPKDGDGPVDFEVAEVTEGTNTLVVLVTWEGEPDPDAEYAYAINVANHGSLDPTVQIIRTSPQIAYSDTLLKFAEQYLDEDAYDYIARVLLPDKSAAE
jgi:hypothetical protein